MMDNLITKYGTEEAFLLLWRVIKKLVKAIRQLVLCIKMLLTKTNEYEIIFAKTKEISEFLLTKNNILIKTKSSSEILTSELGFYQLNVYINDRSPLTRLKKSGRGLLSVMFHSVIKYLFQRPYNETRRFPILRWNRLRSQQISIYISWCDI